MGERTRDAARLCVGCRQHDDRDVLLRFVRVGEPPTLVADVRRRRGGRGVSVHPRRRCVESAVRSGALTRALGVSAPVTATGLAEQATQQYARRAEGLLVAARRARRLAIGTEAAREAIAAGRVALLVVATDAEGSRHELAQAAQRLGSACLLWSTKDVLGKLLGRDTVGVVAVLDSGIADALAGAARCAVTLSEDE